MSDTKKFWIHPNTIKSLYHQYFSAAISGLARPSELGLVSPTDEIDHADEYARLAIEKTLEFHAEVDKNKHVLERPDYEPMT